MKVMISQLYPYANTTRVRFSCGVFCASRTVSKPDDITTGAQEFADGIRRHKKH